MGTALTLLACGGLMPLKKQGAVGEGAGAMKIDGDGAKAKVLDQASQTRFRAQRAQSAFALDARGSSHVGERAAYGERLDSS